MQLRLLKGASQGKKLIMTCLQMNMGQKHLSG
jgi:hypothetical protein